MKKALLVIMCCVALVFCSCNKEEANEKFVGTFSGKTTATATVIFPQLSMSETMDEEFYLTMVIAAGEESDQVIATCSFEDEAFTLNGTVDGDNVDFETISTNINESVDGMSIQVSTSIDLNGTLISNGLSLNGTIEGDGSVSTPVSGVSISSPITIEGTIAGNLAKL
jgi:hypothetical protein